MKNIKTAEEILDKICQENGKPNFREYTYWHEGITLEMATKAIEEYANQFKPEWVSLSFGLPEKDGEYLLRIRIQGGLKESHEVGYFKLRDSEFRTCIENEVPIEITHWCKLPQPPQK